MAHETARMKVKKAYSDNPFEPIYYAVLQVLKEEICRYQLLPGTHLKEMETAERLGVSRSTIRRAFDVLVLEGHVIRRPQSGVEVAPLLRRNYKEIVEIRSMIDSFAARLAAIKRTSQHLGEMEKHLLRLPHSVDLKDKTNADISFHLVIYQAADNPYLIRIYNELDIEMIRSRYLSAEGVSSLTDRIVSEHTEIYEAIKLQDPAKAFEAAWVHSLILLDPKILSSEFLEKYSS